MSEDDTEAEAALLALGAQMEWQPYRMGNEVACPPNAAYEVGRKKQQAPLPFFARFVDDDGYEYKAPDRYQSLAAAKAACERHHATGEWE